VLLALILGSVAFAIATNGTCEMTPPNTIGAGLRCSARQSQADEQQAHDVVQDRDLEQAEQIDYS
jgi:hypothetical protein